MQENSHICIATNTGFAAVNGKYIARLDSDDIWEKEKLENDKTLEVTTLDDLRKSYGLKFKDAKLKKNYNNYIKEAIKQAEESSSSSES